MARVSKADLEARTREAEAQSHILQLGLQCSLCGEIEWIDTKVTKHEDGAYKFGVACLDAPHGGLFFTQFDYPGQNSSFTVQYLDEVVSECRSNPSAEFARVRVTAIDKAVSLRYRTINRTQEANL